MKKIGQIFKGVCSGLAFATLLLAYVDLLIYYASRSNIAFFIVVLGGCVLIIKIADKLELFSDK